MDSASVIHLEIQPLTSDRLPEVVELDRACFGGLWTQEGYERELDSPNSDLLVLSASSAESFEFSILSSQLEKNSSTQHFSCGGAAQTKLNISPAETQHEQNSLTTQNSKLIGIGCLWAILEEAHITILGIHPDYQGKGLGQALLYALLECAQQRGLERATLEVRVSNQTALSLYEKFGFREAGRRRRYYQDTGEDALILWRGDLARSDFSEVLRNWRTQILDRLQQSHFHLSSWAQLNRR